MAIVAMRVATLHGAVLVLLLCGCDVVNNSLPVQVGRDILGLGPPIEPAPGGDRPYPNLATVPARREAADAATRAAMAGALAGDREASREPLAPRAVAATLAGVVAPGEPPLPAGPPARAMLPTPRAIPTGATREATGGRVPVVPELGPVPAPPAADLLAPPPPPPADLLAPRSR